MVSIACGLVSVATRYTSVRRGIGLRSLDGPPHIGLPTGSTGDGAIPFTTPAADVYQANAAVTMPAQPPMCVMYALPPCAALKNPTQSRISVISRVRKTPNTAMLTRLLQRSMYVLKIANASRNHASAFG